MHFDVFLRGREHNSLLQKEDREHNSLLQKEDREHSSLLQKEGSRAQLAPTKRDFLGLPKT